MIARLSQQGSMEVNTSTNTKALTAVATLAIKAQQVRSSTCDYNNNRTNSTGEKITSLLYTCNVKTAKQSQCGIYDIV